MIKGLHHFVLFCQDTEQSRIWYERAGFEYTRGYDGMHWFTLGDAEFMLHPGGHGNTAGSANIHVAVDALDELFATVKTAGFEPFDHQHPGQPINAPVIRPWGQREFELRDPDGYIWGFTEVD